MTPLRTYGGTLGSGLVNFVLITVKNVDRGSTSDFSVSVCSSFKTSGYGNTWEGCRDPLYKLSTNDLDSLGPLSSFEALPLSADNFTAEFVSNLKLAPKIRKFSTRFGRKLTRTVLPELVFEIWMVYHALFL